MFENIEKTLKRNVINAFGWCTKRKVVVFESDDWGSIRMRSKKDYDYFLKKEYDVDKCVYNRNDSLESNHDLEELFNTLSKHRDVNMNHPIFTFNNIVANPDFERIKQGNYEKYYYETFLESLKRYSNHDNVYQLYQEGMDNKLIQTQFHGREHLNIRNWMRALNNDSVKTLSAFEREMFTVQHKGSTSGSSNYLDAFGSGDKDAIIHYNEILSEGLSLFKEIWGFNSTSFIAPTYAWPTEIESHLDELGVKYIQGNHVQKVPKLNAKSGFTRKYHYLGQRNKLGQIYLIRNVIFEPSTNHNFDWINSCLKDISRAFRYNKPAIIGTHRVNYIGSIRQENRSKSLKLLDELLYKIIKVYPEVEFMSSDQLGSLIERN